MVSTNRMHHQPPQIVRKSFVTAEASKLQNRILPYHYFSRLYYQEKVTPKAPNEKSRETVGTPLHIHAALLKSSLGYMSSEFSEANVACSKCTSDPLAAQCSLKYVSRAVLHF